MRRRRTRTTSPAIKWRVTGQSRDSDTRKLVKRTETVSNKEPLFRNVKTNTGVKKKYEDFWGGTVKVVKVKRKE